MKHSYHTPAKELTAYVRTVLHLERSDVPDNNQLPVFTTGMSALCCKTEKDAAGLEHVLQVTLFAPPIPDTFWSMDRVTTIIVYFFKPFALTSLFHVPAKELSKSPIELSNWSPHTYTALKTQLIYADTVADKTAALENLLLQQHIKNQETYNFIQYVTDAIMCNPSNQILNEIVSELKMNERTFQRTFKKYVGITPNQYRRICQFQGSFDQVRARQFEKISDVAFDHGFADQSHFIRSFKEFTDTTPNNYLDNGLTDKK